MMKKIVVSLFFFTLVFLATESFAGGPPGPPTGPPPCWPPPCSIPLDGGISILIAAGAALGGKKLFDLKKKK